ncbi:WIZ protein, partial [Oxylabes madagascariensis]|nr:WIZ protein [Oxylabes madagascariensis]
EDEEMEASRAVAVPPAALELKRTFGAALRAAEVSSEGQRRQLRTAVPVVLLEETPRAAKKPRGAPPERKKMKTKTKKSLPAAGLLLEEPLPLDVLLPLEAPLELEELLGAGGALRHEERRCPYCPDRFHNGIGLANHVRGHLNRVGVSYNVRHFISAEEVKAIER